MMNLAPVIPWAAALTGGGLAIAVVVQARHSLARWTFAAGMVLLAAESASQALETGTSAARWHAVHLAVLALLPGVWLLFSTSYGRGGAPFARGRWRGYAAAYLLLPLAIALSVPDDPLTNLPVRAGSLPLGLAGFVLYVHVLIGALAILVNLERTFRASVGTMRWRIKYMLLGLSVLFAARIYTASQVLAFREYHRAWAELDAGALLLAAVLIVRSLLRSGHFEIGVYPSRAVLHQSVAILLTGFYLLLVGLGAKLLGTIGEEASFPLRAFLVLVALVALAVLLQSDRLQVEIRHLVSRHFQRPQHDYQNVWREFSEGTASRVDLAELAPVFVRLTARTFDALLVNLWVIEERQECLALAASTATTGLAPDLYPNKTDTEEIIRHFRQHPDPVALEKATFAWARSLLRANPGQFAHGGDHLGVPLIGGGEVLGVLVLGDRVRGAPFSGQDLDLLTCVANHGAAALLTARLVQRLAQARELEAFQTMATFFVHDLKNAASSLGLMVQNLPAHLDDPAFRQDALRGVSKVVTHINELIARLNQLRQKFEVKATPGDLNALVRRILAATPAPASVATATAFGSLPAVPFDAEQLGKVVTNLLLNAFEAIAADGQVHIATAADAAGVRLTVTDNGCGMSPAFRERDLFRPFQTTKKNGLGIGMFQSRMIVAAHGGRITVESTPGRGSTFTVTLPPPDRLTA